MHCELAETKDPARPPDNPKNKKNGRGTERAEKAEEALDNHKVSLGQMSGEQLAENRDYGHSMIDNISAARFAQPAAGQGSGEFQELVSRLNSL